MSCFWLAGSRSLVRSLTGAMQIEYQQNLFGNGKNNTDRLSRKRRGGAEVVHENQQPIETFACSFQTMFRHIKPGLQGLVEQPDRPDRGSFVIEPYMRVFDSMHGRAVLLGLEHLARLASVMTVFLEKLLCGTVLYTSQHIALLAESCTFLEQGLTLVSAEGTDMRLAESINSLTAAVNAASQRENGSMAGKHEHPELPEWMRETFISEVDHLLVNVEQECVLWDFIAVDLERVADLGRMLRLLQQRFAVYGFSDPERLCSALASTLTRYVHGDFFQTAYPERILLRTVDTVREAARQFVDTDDFTVPDADQLAASIQGMMRQPIGEMLVAAGLVDSTTVNRALEVQHASSDKQPPRLGEVLVAMGAVTPEQVQLLLQEQQYNRVRNEQVAPAAGNASSTDKDHGPSTIAGDYDNLDIGRLSRMGFLLDQLFAMQFPEAARPLLAELRDHLRICHRVALHGLADRLQKLAVDVAVKGNKRLHCHLEGVELLYEMEEIGLLVESLLHLVANAAKHGIESMEERLCAGKEKVGQLRITVTQVDAELLVAVEDDGRGFDFAHAAAAINTTEHMARGKDAAPTSWMQFERLLAQAAAEQAQYQEDSGGKQGLVAVRAFLHEQGGSMDVTSFLGKGTCVTLRLPRKHCTA